ncbi:MAG: hypothetical protein US20_C0023G0015 [Candidatus Pacebacteria bacterium GW2011_GWF1_36_5]|nr:MAG: hypothetical protein US20_C0023G0015 [Candidatus Pacebacteria bacterium GW2011_GWF1_36_5]
MRVREIELSKKTKLSITDLVIIFIAVKKVFGEAVALEITRRH